MKILKIFLMVVGGLIAVMVTVGFAMSVGMGEIKKLSINDVDLSKINDGAYIGSYHKGRWTYDARVTVKDHHIAVIENTNKKMSTMKDFNGKAEAEMIKKQTPRIDVVSGATVNTKAYAKAVENALTSATAH